MMRPPGRRLQAMLDASCRCPLAWRGTAASAATISIPEAGTYAFPIENPVTKLKATIRIALPQMPTRLRREAAQVASSATAIGTNTAPWTAPWCHSGVREIATTIAVHHATLVQARTTGTR